jgi:hypothetical protein
MPFVSCQENPRPGRRRDPGAEGASREEEGREAQLTHPEPTPGRLDAGRKWTNGQASLSFPQGIMPPGATRSP